MDAIILCVAGMMLVAGLLLAYVGWQVNRKRQAMQFITISERKKFQTITITAVAIMFSALIGLGTVVVG